MKYHKSEVNESSGRPNFQGRNILRWNVMFRANCELYCSISYRSAEWGVGLTTWSN